MTGNAAVRTELNLLSNNQSKVEYGNLISLPVGNGMLYVEPIYVKTSQLNAVPQLQKVLMSYGDGGSYVVLADSLKSGLDQLVAQGKNASTGTGTTTPPPTGTGNNNSPPTLTGPLAQAATQLDAAIAKVKAAQQSGNFAAYGQALQELDTATTNFQNALKAAGATPAATPTPVPTPSG
jgi:uncharacterized membrane protein (UPF0182 family)